MCFSRWILMGILVPAAALSGDKAVDDILEASREIKQRTAEETPSVPATNKAESMLDKADAAWLKGRELPALETDNTANATQQQRAWGQTMSATEQGAEAGKRAAASSGAGKRHVRLHLSGNAGGNDPVAIPPGVSQ